jgi:hypothetical protein
MTESTVPLAMATMRKIFPTCEKAEFHNTHSAEASRIFVTIDRIVKTDVLYSL